MVAISHPAAIQLLLADLQLLQGLLMLLLFTSSGLVLGRSDIPSGISGLHKWASLL